MEISGVLQSVGILMGALGGGSVIIFSLSGWLGKIWAERLMKKITNKHEIELTKIKDQYQSELEKLKVKLKKSEFLFEHEFSATSALVRFHEEIMPLSQHSGMHMDDVYIDIVKHFSEIEQWIKEYVSTHGAILSEGVATELMMAARTSGQHKFKAARDDAEITGAEFNAGEYVYHCIHNARSSMRKSLIEQTTH